MTKTIELLSIVGLALLLGSATGCDDEPPQMLPDMAMAPGDMTMTPTGDMAMIPANYNTDMLCYSNAMTHIEIINSCADGVDRLAKNPVLPKLNPDGTRPPLP